MSRSYRKPWIKDHQKPCSLSLKKLHRRRERRIAKQIVNEYKTTYPDCLGCECMEYWDEEFGILIWSTCPFLSRPPFKEIPIRKELVNYYDICDYRWFVPAFRISWWYSKETKNSEVRLYSRK